MYRKSLLPNGIRVVSETIPYVKSVSLGIWIGSGSRSEQDDNHGISHFIEHLMFKGTVKRSARDIAETVDAIGGQLNAFTAKEHTCYYMKVLDTHLDLALDILSDMLLASKFATEDIGREREVVLEEVHMYEDTPDELVHDIHLSRIWKDHPLGRNILGSKESIASFNRDMVSQYYRNFYTPDNIVIAAAGNLDHDKLADMATRYFSGMAGMKSITPPKKAPVLSLSRTVQTKDTEQVHLCLGTLGVPQNSPEMYKIHILNNILGGGISSRLFQSVREDRGLAYSIYSYQTNYSDAGLFTIYAGTRPANAEEVIQLILKNLSEIKYAGITAEELRKSKEQLKGSLLLGLESSSSRMSRIGKMEITLGKFIPLDEVVEKIDKVTLSDVKEAAERLFRDDLLCFTAVGPIDSEEIINKLNFEL